MKVLFRAKTIKQDFKEETESLRCISGVWYAIGDILEDKYISIPESENVYFPDKPKVLLVLKAIEIDPSTKAINIEGMLDSKNKPIFASLNKNGGKGGDILLFDDGRDIRELVCMYCCYTMDLVPIRIIKDSYKFNGCTLNENVKVIGIQK